jgi:PAS domain S-box-containing protein
MRSVKLLILNIFCVSLILGVIFFRHYHNAMAKGEKEFFAQQMRLARQSALLIEQQGEGVAPEAVMKQLFGDRSQGLLENNQIAFYSREKQRISQLADLPAPLMPSLESRRDLAQRLQRGTHGSLSVDSEKGGLLLTFLPLDHKTTLVVAAARDEALASIKLMGRSLWLLVLLPPAVFLMAWPFRREQSERHGGKDCQVDSEAVSDLKDQNRLLEQENSMLSVARREYQLLVEGSNIGLARLNSNGQIQFCSHALLDLVGCRREDLAGRNLLDLDIFPAADQEILRNALAEVREGVCARPVITTLLPGKTDHSVEVYFTPLHIEGTLTGIIAWLRPVDGKFNLTAQVC